MTSDASGRADRSFVCDPSSVGSARQFVASQLAANDGPQQLIDDFRLIVSELVTNVIEHGSATTIDVCLDVSDPEWWEVAVSGGRSLPADVAAPQTWSVADPSQHSGRGLGIVLSLSDEVVVDSSEYHLAVRCRRRRMQPSLIQPS